MKGKKIQKIAKKIIKNKVIKIGSLSMIATIMIRAINLISVPIFSRLLSTSEYGQVDVFMTYVNIFMIILGLDFHAAVAKGRLDFENEADQFVISSILFSSIFAIVAVAIINIFFEYIQFIFGLEQWMVNLMFVYSYSMYLISYRTSEFNFYYQYRNNMKMNVSVALLNVMLSVVLIQTFFKEYRTTGRILGAMIPTVICAIGIFFYYGNRGGWAFKLKYNAYSLKYSVPLIPHNLSHLILGNADKVMINSMIGASESGIYSLAYTLGLMIQVVVEGMNQLFMPWLFRKLQEEDYKSVKLVQRLFVLLFCIPTIAIMAVSPEILQLFGAKQFWGGKAVIMWIVFATYVGFGYTIYVNIEFFYKTTGIISIGTIVAAVINIMLNMLFLRRFGYTFAAASTVLSYLSLFFLHMFIVNRVIKKDIVDNVFMLFQLLGVTVVAFILYYYLETIVIRMLVAIIAIILICFLWWIIYKKNREHIKL